VSPVNGIPSRVQSQIRGKGAWVPGNTMLKQQMIRSATTRQAFGIQRVLGKCLDQQERKLQNRSSLRWK
jgi:hypothetical protein